MDDKLPDNVIPITTLSINRDKRKHCTCIDRTFEIDATNHEVICTKCGVIVDAFDALYDIARHYERLQNEANRLLKQAKELANYKPWLLSIKRIESNIRNGEMIPTCPHCHQGILLEELNGYTNKKMELERRKFKR